MATFRLIYHALWNDEMVLEFFSTEEKLFWVFLLTNKCTTQLGIYKLNLLEVCFYTGFSKETVSELLDRFENKYKIIKYNKDTREICIVKWAKYNINRLGGKPAIDCLRSEIKKVEDKSLLSITLEYTTKEEMRKLFIEAIEGHRKNKKEVDKGNGNRKNEYRKIKGKNELLYEKPTQDQIRRAEELWK